MNRPFDGVAGSRLVLRAPTAAGADGHSCIRSGADDPERREALKLSTIDDCQRPTSLPSRDGPRTRKGSSSTLWHRLAAYSRAQLTRAVTSPLVNGSARAATRQCRSSWLGGSACLHTSGAVLYLAPRTGSRGADALGSLCISHLVCYRRRGANPRRWNPSGGEARTIAPLTVRERVPRRPMPNTRARKGPHHGQRSDRAADCRR